MNSRGSAHPFDAGLQLERTALAWRRTCLAFAVSDIAGMRVLSVSIGAWALIPGLTCLIVMGVVMGLAHRRYASMHVRLTSMPESPHSEGVALHVLCVALLLAFGGIALVSVLHYAFD